MLPLARSARSKLGLSWTKDPDLDKVFVSPEGRVNCKFGATGSAVGAAAFERLTGEPEPDFTASVRPVLRQATKCLVYPHKKGARRRTSSSRSKPAIRFMNLK